MDPRPPNLLLLLTSLLHVAQCDTTQPSYTIDSLGLIILPSSSVRSGTAVTLRCQVSISHDNIPDLTHAFQFTRDNVLIHSANTTEDSVEYKLDPARAADSGSYQCRVRVKDKSKASFEKTLNVTGLQTPILHLDETEAFENAEFSATCSAPEEKGPLTFRFYLRFRTGPHRMLKQLPSIGNSADVTLVLRQLGDSFLYCDYEMYLPSGPRKSSSSNDTHVLVKGLVPKMTVTPPDEIFEGDILEVVCKVEEVKDVDVFLIKNKRILKMEKNALSHRFRVQKDDSGELVCKAERHSAQGETYSTITVKELVSEPRLTSNLRDIFEGDEFTLTCSVKIYYPERISNNSIQFDIYKDNLNPIKSDTYKTVAAPDKNGNYTCKVQTTSSVHSFVKESQKLIIKAKVPVSVPKLSVVGGTLVLGKPFQLLCHSSSGTLPITYTLNFFKKALGVRVVRLPGERAVFNCSVSRSTDLKEFSCHARNSPTKSLQTGHGQELQRSTKIIEPVSKPELKIKSSTGDVPEGHSVTLVCSVEHGTPPFTFSWYHVGKEGALQSNTSRTMEVPYTIHKVKSEDGGEYYCESGNSANEIRHSDVARIRVTMAAWKKALIAFFCILLILLLILAFIFKKCPRQFKRRRTGELSVKSASTKMERLSLTQAEVIEANATPGMMGKSIWSEHVSGSDSDDQNSVAAAEPQYAEVQTRQADPNRDLVIKGTNTVNSEVRNSTQGVPVQAEGRASVQYTLLNNETSHREGDAGHHEDDARHHEDDARNHEDDAGHLEEDAGHHEGDAGHHKDDARHHEDDAGDHGGDAGHGGDGNQGNHSVQDEHIVEIDNSVDIRE
ncbi:hypothetical protein Q5P01_017569 [Channa striata]|uniref:Platelet endothelial cell adhesion molecule n=1 Tax=Channa striata TaxID=64152 RepID=A0AA88MA71_CHASR|nr:hypothetical protein Q5P01_017569 [Channa striata]